MNAHEHDPHGASAGAGASPPYGDGPHATRPRFDAADMADGAAVRKADVGKRIVAVIIDAVIGAVIGLIPWIGGLIAAAYWLLRDGLEFEFMDQRSIGKKVMKLRPVTLDGRRTDLAASAARNWMFALGGLISLLLFIPIIGWLLIIPVALAAIGIAIVELVLVLTDAEGRRFGDRLAGTRVIEVPE